MIHASDFQARARWRVWRTIYWRAYFDLGSRIATPLGLRAAGRDRHPRGQPDHAQELRADCESRQCRRRHGGGPALLQGRRQPRRRRRRRAAGFSTWVSFGEYSTDRRPRGHGNRRAPEGRNDRTAIGRLVRTARAGAFPQALAPCARLRHAVRRGDPRHPVRDPVPSRSASMRCRPRPRRRFLRRTDAAAATINDIPCDWSGRPGPWNAATAPRAGSCICPRPRRCRPASRSITTRPATI